MGSQNIYCTLDVQVYGIMTGHMTTAYDIMTGHMTDVAIVWWNGMITKTYLSIMNKIQRLGFLPMGSKLPGDETSHISS